MKYTLSDILDFFTGGEFYMVVYKNKIFVLSSYRLGDEDFDWGVYDVLDINSVKNGAVENFDCIPDIFVDSLLDDLSNFVSDDVAFELYNSAVDEWYEILEKEGASDEVKDYIDISKVFAGINKLQGETVTEKPDDYEKECIEKYISEYY